MGKNVAKSFSNKFPLQLIKIPTFFARDSRKLFPSSSRNPISVSIKNLPCSLSSTLVILYLLSLYFCLFIQSNFPLGTIVIAWRCSTRRRHNWSSCKTNLETLRGWRRRNLRGGCFINYESHDKVPAWFCVVSKFFHSIKWDFQVKSVGTGAGAVWEAYFKVSIVKLNDCMTLQF